MSGSQHHSEQRLTDRLPIKEGGVVGVAAYVVGLGVTFVLFQLDSDLQDELLAAQFEELGAGTLDAVVWVFHAGHFVELEVSTSGADQVRSGSVDIFSEASTSLPDLLYHVVPIVVLLGAGYLLLQRVGAASSAEAAKSGVTLLVGYLPLAAVMPFVFRISESEGFGGESVSFTVAPEMTTSILLAGIVFPAVLGAAGGYIWFTREGSRATGHGPAQQPPAGQQPPGAGPQQPRQGQQQSRGRQAGGQQNGGRGSDRQRQQGDSHRARQQQGDQRRGHQQDDAHSRRDEQDRQ